MVSNENMQFINNSFYKNKKVLITGHTGFKGSWLTIWLNILGADIAGIALDPKTDRDLFVLSGIGKSVNDYRQDIRNLRKIKEIFHKEKPEIVFHFAAQPLVLESYKTPVTTYATNVMGTVNILEAIRLAQSVRSVVMITSDKCYENMELKRGYKENDPMGGSDPYSSSKGASELVINAYKNSFFKNKRDCYIASVRAGNVIGGGDWSKNRIIPDCVRAFEKNKPVFLRNPEAVRPWQHVLEPLGAYLMLAEAMFDDNKYDEAWNFGPDKNSTNSVKNLVKKFIHYYGLGMYNLANKEYPHETTFLALDTTKARTKLGWEPVLDFEDTIKYTADWYKNYRDTDVLKLTLDQILKYTKNWKLKKGN